jgi:hypothetical protein
MEYVFLYLFHFVGRSITNTILLGEGDVGVVFLFFFLNEFVGEESIALICILKRSYNIKHDCSPTFSSF